MQTPRGSTPTTHLFSALPVDSARLDVPDASGRSVVHLIEAQRLFVPTLVEVLEEAGLTVHHVGPALDPRRLLDDDPDIVFIDADFLEEPLEGIRLAHVLVPRARICVYATATNDVRKRAFAAAGADAVLDKSIDRRQIVQDLRAISPSRG
jgi:DNA-binding NarL/FixJ family response regulator